MRRLAISLAAAACLISCSERIGHENHDKLLVAADSTAIYGKGLNVIITSPGDDVITASITVLDRDMRETGAGLTCADMRIDGRDTLSVDLSSCTIGHYSAAVTVLREGAVIHRDTTAFRYLPSISYTKRIIRGETKTMSMLISPSASSLEIRPTDEKLTMGPTRIQSRQMTSKTYTMASCDIEATGLRESSVCLDYDGMGIVLPVGIYAPIEAKVSCNAYGNMVLSLRDVSKCNISSVKVRADISATGLRDRYEDNLLTDSMLAQIEFDESTSGRESPLRRHSTDTLSYRKAYTDDSFIIPSVTGYAEKAVDRELIQMIGEPSPSVRFIKFVLDYGQDVTGGVQVPTFDTSKEYYRPLEWNLSLIIDALDGYVDIRLSQELLPIPDGIDSNVWRRWADRLSVYAAGNRIE